MDASLVYKLLNPHAEQKPDVKKFVRALERVVKTGLDQDAADMVAHQAAEIILQLGNDRKAALGLPVVERYLALSPSIPATPKRKQYFVAFALNAVEKSPAIATRLVAALLQDAIVDRYYGVMIAARLAKLGLLDPAAAAVTQSLAAGATIEAVLAEPALKKAYKNARFAAAVAGGLDQSRADAAILKTEPAPDDFDEVIAAAKAELMRTDRSGRRRRIRAVSRFTKHREQVDAFLSEGFELLKRKAKQHDKLIDQTLYDALACTIGDWKNPDLAALVMREIAYVSAEDDDASDGISRHYELNQVAGTLARTLVALDYKGRLTPLDAFLKSYGSRYDGEDFVMQARYAKWLLRGDGAGALAYVVDKDNDRGLAYAACALADLHHKPGRAALEALLPTLENPVTIEAVTEAIARLRRQTTRPAPNKRMIVLFGEITRTEMALGAETDNQFVLRGQKRTRRPDLGAVREVDDSAPRDRRRRVETKGRRKQSG